MIVDNDALSAWSLYLRSRLEYNESARPVARDRWPGLCEANPLGKETRHQECRSGEGPRCIAKRKTTQERRTDVEVAETLLRQLPIEGRENGKIKKAAELLAFFRGWSQAETEKGLALLWPFIPPLVCELLTIVFLHFGFAVSAPVRRKPIEAKVSQETEETEQVNPGKPSGGSRRPMTREETERFVVTELALGRLLPSQDWLAAKAGVRKSTVHKWLTEWERQGLISRARAGKCKVIQAA
jgi:hypothetical protein